MIAALTDRLIGVAGDGASTEDRETDKRSGSVENRVSEEGVATERRVGEGCWVDITSERADNLEAGLGRTARGGRPGEDCNG